MVEVDSISCDYLSSATIYIFIIGNQHLVQARYLFVTHIHEYILYDGIC